MAEALLISAGMKWPTVSVERVRPSRFIPPFCPRPDCCAHAGRGSGFNRYGYYKKCQGRIGVPRYLCRDCRHTCSRQTFSTTYYLKRPGLQVRIASGLVASSAHRQIARSERCAKTTVTRQAERLGRHAILFHARARVLGPEIDEAIVHDHFETFVTRQDHALGVGTAVGARSWYVYDVDPAPHRGSGRPRRKPEAQPREIPRRPYVESIKRTFVGLSEKVPAGEKLIFRCDGRLDYRVAAKDPALASRVVLQVHPNPERGPKGSARSREAIDRDAAMWTADTLHLFVRHSHAEHKRETIAQARSLESIVGRLHLHAAWKNFIKRRTERRPDRSTPAMWRGVTDSPWIWERLLAQRLFSTRESLSAHALRLYTKTWTRNLPPLNLQYAG